MTAAVSAFFRGLGLLMGGVPGVSGEAFERWPERLRAAGYELVVVEHDHQFGVGDVSKEGKTARLGLPRHPSGTASVFVTGRNSGWRNRAFVWGIVEALRQEDSTAVDRDDP